jgi:hypothetical protein
MCVYLEGKGDEVEGDSVMLAKQSADEARDSVVAEVRGHVCNG